MHGTQCVLPRQIARAVDHVLELGEGGQHPIESRERDVSGFGDLDDGECFGESAALRPVDGVAGPLHNQTPSQRTEQIRGAQVEEAVLSGLVGEHGPVVLVGSEEPRPTLAVGHEDEPERRAVTGAWLPWDWLRELAGTFSGDRAAAPVRPSEVKVWRIARMSSNYAPVDPRTVPRMIRPDHKFSIMWTPCSGTEARRD